MIKSFIKKIALFFIPFWLVVVSFFVLDPFKILYDYTWQEYSNQNVTLNPSFISTKKYLKNKNRYDSFIFGSSRTMGFRSWHWKKRIEAKEVLVFNSAGESLYGLNLKLKFIDNQNDTIKNALILFDVNLLSNINENFRHINIQSYHLTNKSKYYYYGKFLLVYLDLKFLISYLDFSITKKYKSYMKDYLKKTGIFYDNISNDWQLLHIDQQIKQDSVTFYSKLIERKVFYQRNSVQKFYPNFIKEKQKVMLTDNCGIFL